MMDTEDNTSKDTIDIDKENRIKELEAALEQAKSTGIISKPIEGVFKVKLETADGKKVTKTLRFKPGRIRTPLSNGHQVGTEALIRIANGGKATEKEMTLYPYLHEVTREIATARLQQLAEMGASYLEEVK